MMKHFLRRYLYIMREEEIIVCVLREGGKEGGRDVPCNICNIAVNCK